MPTAVMQLDLSNKQAFVAVGHAVNGFLGGAVRMLIRSNAVGYMVSGFKIGSDMSVEP